MVAHKQKRYITPQEYLEYERKAETRSEYEDGQIVAMAGASRPHSLIVGNLFRSLGNQLEESPCEIHSTEMRVRVPECNKYYYPDVVVACGEIQFEDAEVDTLLNPTLIVEVLSDSTEKKDRGEKLSCYRTLPSLTTYLLVSQHRPYVEMYRRQASETWLYSAVATLEGQVVLDTIGCTLRLADIYARVSVPPINPEAGET